MTEIDRQALTGLDLSKGRWLEMGPLCCPRVIKGESEVYYIDHCSTEELRTKYPLDPNIDPTKIVEVDFIDDGRPLSSILCDKQPFDNVVASHVIEHVPNLVGWLRRIHDILKPSGILALWIPDKRFTFDLFRRLTPFEEVITAEAENHTRPGLRCIMDYFAYGVAIDCWHLWNDYSIAKTAKFIHGPEFLEVAARDYVNGKYIDVHCWVFTPWSFLDLMGQITERYNLGFDLKWFGATPLHDLQFMVQLEKNLGGKSSTDWEEAAKTAYRDGLVPPNAKETAATLGIAM